MDEDVDYSVNASPVNATTMPPAPDEPLDPVAEITIVKTNLNDLFLVLMGAIILFMQVWTFRIECLRKMIDLIISNHHNHKSNFSVGLCTVGSRQRPLQERHQHPDEECRGHVRWMARFLVMRVTLTASFNSLP